MLPRTLTYAKTQFMRRFLLEFYVLYIFHLLIKTNLNKLCPFLEVQSSPLSVSTHTAFTALGILELGYPHTPLANQAWSNIDMYNIGRQTVQFLNNAQVTNLQNMYEK